MTRKTTIMVHKTYYQVAVATLIGSVFWVGLGIYNSLTKTDNVEIKKEMLEKLDPTIDEATIKNIFERRQVLEGVDLSILAASPATSEENQSVQPEATESAQVNELPIPEATKSAASTPKQ